MATGPSPLEKAADAVFAECLALVEPEHRVHAGEYKKFFLDMMVNPTGLTDIDGYKFLPGFEAPPAKYAYNQLEYSSSDVLVSTYPKSGTTWVTAIVKQIIYGGQLELLEDSLKVNQFFSYLEFGPESKYRVTENLQLPRKIYGTHLPAPLVNLDKLKQHSVKIVYVIRNPKDRAVSFYNFIKPFPFLKKDEFKKIFPPKEREFYDTCFRAEAKSIAGIVDDYLDSLKSWWKHRDDDNILFVVYEELKKHTHAEIKRIASFLGVPLDEEGINAVVEKTTFSKMKKDAEEAGHETEGGITMFRKGQIGEWKDHLTVAQSEHVDRKVQEVLGDTDIKFIYE